MQLKSFRVEMYRCIIDSGWIQVSPLTVMVGKNEAGKTSLLKALHKLNPFRTEPYSIDQEWPRGRRRARNNSQVICRAKFSLSTEEIAELGRLSEQDVKVDEVEVVRDYSNKLDILVPPDLFPESMHPADIEAVLQDFPQPTAPVSEPFHAKVEECRTQIQRLAREGRFTELEQAINSQTQRLRENLSPQNSNPHHQNENTYIVQYSEKLKEVNGKLQSIPSIRKKAHEYLLKQLPTFVYMSDYKSFTGTAQLDHVKQRVERNQASEEDKTLLAILELSGLRLDEEVQKANSANKEQRQYDLDDAAATLTRTIAERWKQRRYEVQFRGDGQSFFTFVKDERDPSLIKLEERSKGFQWFFSFDLMFMYESKGTFKNCVVLLDEPGLHLHPGAQRDLLKRMEEYARENILIYTTHLPFMIDLEKPDRIRILSEGQGGTTVTEDLNQSQPDAKFVLQAALGMTGSTSYLLAKRNLVVEGVDDYWFITELSSIFNRSGLEGLPDDLMITPAGGASEAAYIATFMIGQKLEVAVLLDSDQAGSQARDSLVKRWLSRYNSHPATVLSLNEAIGTGDKEASIEDLFPEDYYLAAAREVYKRDLERSENSLPNLSGNGQIVKKVQRAFEIVRIRFNKGSVAKLIRSKLARMLNYNDLPSETITRCTALFKTIRAAFPNTNQTAQESKQQ